VKNLDVNAFKVEVFSMLRMHGSQLNLKKKPQNLRPRQSNNAVMIKPPKRDV
jgi:hypothetical protein